jgi:hypothetical protein
MLHRSESRDYAAAPSKTDVIARGRKPKNAEETR